MRSKAQELERLSRIRVVNAGYRGFERLRSKSTVEVKVPTTGDMVNQSLDEARKQGAAIKTKRNGHYLSLGSSYTQCEAIKRKLVQLHNELSRERLDTQRRRKLVALIERDTARFIELGKTVQANYASLDNKV